MQTTVPSCLAFPPVRLALLTLVALATRAAGQSPELLFEEAHYREVAAADPEGAIEGYEAVLKLPGVPARVTARAHLRLGILFHWKGEAKLSRQHLERVTSSHAREADLVRTARRFLGQPVMDDPATFLPEDVLFYVEILEPRENIRGLSALLEGTPFQNPVDYYVSSLARSASANPDGVPAPDDRRRGVIPDAAAFLNEGFLREMQLVEALAIAVPAGGRPENDFLAVLDPGASNILRGLVQMGLTISGAEPAGTVRDAAVFRLPAPKEAPHIALDDRPHLALGGGVVLLGRPRKLVEEAVDRGDGRLRSLADSPDFQRAKAAHAGGIVFSYIGPQRAVEALRRGLSRSDLPLFDAFVRSLGLERFHPAGITISRNDATDSLRLEARTRVDTEGFDAWQGLAAPALDPEILRVVPSASLAYFATSFDRAPERVDAIYRAAQPFLDLLRAEPGGHALDTLESARDLLTKGPGKALLEDLEGIALTAGTAAAPAESFTLCVVARLRTPEAGAQLIEGAVTAFFQRFLKNAASRTFEAETLSLGGKDLPARFLEPMPGIRLRYLRLERSFVLSFSANALVEAAAAHASGQNAAAAPLPAGAGKLLVVRPAAILRLRTGKSGLPDGTDVILGEVPRMVFSTREERDGVAMDILIPEATPTARAILNRVAEQLSRRRAGTK